MSSLDAKPGEKASTPFENQVGRTRAIQCVTMVLPSIDFAAIRLTGVLDQLILHNTLGVGLNSAIRVHSTSLQGEAGSNSPREPDQRRALEY